MADNNLADHVTVVFDQVDAMEFLCGGGNNKLCRRGNPAEMVFYITMPHMDGNEQRYSVFVEAMKQVGFFWAATSELPPEGTHYNETEDFGKGPVESLVS